ALRPGSVGAHRVRQRDLRAPEEGLGAARVRQAVPQVALVESAVRTLDRYPIRTRSALDPRPGRPPHGDPRPAENARWARGYLWKRLGGERDSARRMRDGPTRVGVPVTVFFAKDLVSRRSDDNVRE